MLMTERPRFERADKDAQEKFAEAQEAIASGDVEALEQQLRPGGEAMAQEMAENTTQLREAARWQIEFALSEGPRSPSEAAEAPN